MKIGDKVQHLLNKPYRINYWDCYNDESASNEEILEQTIDNALIVVEEVVSQWEYIDTYISNGMGDLNPNLKYWQEVREELIKLKTE